MGHTRGDLLRVWEADIAYAKRSLVERGRLAPVWLLRNREGATVRVPAGWTTRGEQARAEALVRIVAIAVDAVSITHLGEAALTLFPGTPVLPREQPERRLEIIVVALEGTAEEDGGLLKAIEVLEILRDEQGNTTGTRTIDLPTPEQGFSFESTGEILPALQPSRASRIAAAIALRRMGVELPANLLLDSTSSPLPARADIVEALEEMGFSSSPHDPGEIPGTPTLH